MARTARVKSREDGTVYYHLTSRAANKQFLFKDVKAKDKLAELICKAAEFSGIELEAWAVMDNHFHIVCKVVRGEAIPEEEIVKRVGVLMGEKVAEALKRKLERLSGESLEVELERYRSRMCDISGYMKTLKEMFAVWYNKEYDYSGSVWSGVFKSTMIEDGQYMENCRRYVALNPVRAGIVSQVMDYRWVWVRNHEEAACQAGCLPVWMMRRVPQLSSGKIYGSAAFVEKWAWRLGSKFPAASVVARVVHGNSFATHGWRLAAKAAAQIKVVA